MSTIVAGYFDSEDEATQAMDQLLNDPAYRNAESEVISTVAGGTGNVGDAGVIPVVPHTSTGQGNTVIGGVPVTGGHRLLNELGDREAEYFRSALKGGGVLALIKVDDESAMHVRQVFNQLGARTYQA